MLAVRCRSTYRPHHYRSRRAGQAHLTERIREIAATRVRYGYRRIHVLLRREHQVVQRQIPRARDNELVHNLLDWLPKWTTMQGNVGAR